MDTIQTTLTRQWIMNWAKLVMRWA